MTCIKLTESSIFFSKNGTHLNYQINSYIILLMPTHRKRFKFKFRNMCYYLLYVFFFASLYHDSFFSFSWNFTFPLCLLALPADSDYSSEKVPVSFHDFLHCLPLSTISFPQEPLQSAAHCQPCYISQYYHYHLRVILLG